MSAPGRGPGRALSRPSVIRLPALVLPPRAESLAPALAPDQVDHTHPAFADHRERALVG